VLLVLLSALCFASLNILAQLAYRVGVPAGTLASARFLLAAAVFWPLALGLRRRLPRRRDAIVALAVGLVYSAASELLFESLTQTKAALVDLLFFTYPALVVAAASLSGREGWTARRAFSVCVSLVGSLLVLGGGLSGLHATGAAFALAAAALYAVYVLLSSDLLARVDALVLVALVSAGAAGGTTSAGLALHQLRVPHGAEPVVLVAAVGLVSAVLGIGSFIAGVARLGASRASILSTTEPILTAALALLCFGDRLGPIQLGGGALVLAAIVVLERSPAPSTRRRALLSPPARRPDTKPFAARRRALREPIVVRVAESGDVPALERLAALDSRPLPRGALVVAAVEREIVAATALAGKGDAVCDSVPSDRAPRRAPRASRDPDPTSQPTRRAPAHPAARNYLIQPDQRRTACI
jgi:drug/metabolite transporter (DMT)-like permease